MENWSKVIQDGSLERPEFQAFRPTMQLRWAQVDHTTTQPARLQQAWKNITVGGIEWRDVPTEIVAALPPAGER